MQIEFDPDKRDQTLAQRGLDFARAIEVFGGVNVSAEEARFDYGEPRFTTVGVLDGRMVIVVWTPRGEVRRIISMRKANEPRWPPQTAPLMAGQIAPGRTGRIMTIPG